MCGYDDAQAHQIFRGLIETPAVLAITEGKIIERFHRRVHLPIVLASGLIDKPVEVRGGTAALSAWSNSAENTKMFV